MQFGLSAHERLATRASIERQVFDLVIVGGGISGTSIAREAILRGYTVALLEQGDLGSGTSSRSSRLIHGGLRYLEHGDVGLVFESVLERARLARLARHLVRPQPFVVPIYRGDRPGRFVTALGLCVYDLLAILGNYRRHRLLSRRGILHWVSSLRKHELRGGALYYDFRTDDFRLVLENALDAAARGAHIFTHCRVGDVKRHNGRISAVMAQDTTDGTKLVVRGRVFVGAVGPWTNRLLTAIDRNPAKEIRPTLGVHVAVPYEFLPIDAAVFMRHPRDGRVLFALPFYERTVLGTTDTDYQGDPEAITARSQDIDYLIEVANHYFPGCQLQRQHVISTWAGLRPLLAGNPDDSPSDLSREHRIQVRNDGLVLLTGGKLTTYRRLAEKCLTEIEKLLGVSGARVGTRRSGTNGLPLPGSCGLEHDSDLDALAAELGRQLGRPMQTMGRHLATTYGVRSRGIVADVQANQQLGDPIIRGLPFIWAEVPFAVREDGALHLDDVLIRRIPLFYRALDQGLSVVDQVAELIAQDLAWSDETTRREIKNYQKLVDRSRSWQRN